MRYMQKDNNTIGEKAYQRKMEVPTMSFFKNTPRGETYLYKLCNEDDAREGVDVVIPEPKPMPITLKVPIWARFIKFKNFITP